jgi:hypothetical protein
MLEPNFRGTSPALPSMVPMGGQLVGFNGSQTRNGQLFLPDHFQHGHGQPSQLSTSESTGTTSSQYSVPHRNSPFENYMVCHLLLLSIVSHNLNIIKTTSTSTSSFESGWSNIQADSALVSIEQYRSLQARFKEMQREHSNLVKQCDLLEAKNSALKYVLLHCKLQRLAILNRLNPGRHMNTWLHGSLLPLANMLY